MANERKPYVRYELSAPIEDKGIAFTVREAVNVFLKKHGFEGHLTDFQASSDNFRAILEIYDNGKYDFNVRALSEHLGVSGQLPTKEKKRPNVSIIPLSCDATSVVQGADYTAYEKTIEALHRRAKEGEESLKGLTAALAERQQAVQEASERIETLETRLQRADPKQFPTPREAIMGSYLKTGLTGLLEIHCDLDELTKANVLGNFIAIEGRPTNLAMYVRQFYGIPTKDDAELKIWESEMAKYEKWEETEEGKSIKEKCRRFDADKSLLKTAEESGASPEIIELLKTKVAESEASKAQIIAEEEREKEGFYKQREAYLKLEEIRKEYEIIRKVAVNSEKRRAKNFSIPILAETKRTDNPEVTFILPSLGAESLYEQRITEKVVGNMQNRAGVNSATKRTEGDFNIWTVQFEQGQKERDVLGDANAIMQQVANDDLAEALGITNKIISLDEL